MRRKYILSASLPLGNALSLANFQDISSILIPLTCQFTYDQQIPFCTVSDFQKTGCSSACASSLTAIANSVSQACSNVNVNSDTLLGIIKNGGILVALCPTMQATTAQSTETAAQSTIANSVTIPTASPGVVIATTSSKSTPIAQSAISTTRITSSRAATSTDETAAEPPTTTALQSAGGGLGEGESTPTITVTQDESSTSSKASSPTKNAKPQADTGGGSPFDISSNNGHHGYEGGSVLAIVVAALACMLLGR